MANAARGRRARSARTHSRPVAAVDDRARVVAAALALAADGRWPDTRMSDLAARTGIRLAALHRLFPTREAVVDEFVRNLDASMVAAGCYAPDDPAPARDRLFDVVMRRIDALTPHRDAVAALMRHAACDPYAGFCAVFRLGRSLPLMLEAAGSSAAGAAGALRVKGLALIWLNALRVWLTDDSADLAKTMAALDKGLRQAEAAAAFVTRQRQGTKSPDGG